MTASVAPSGWHIHTTTSLDDCAPTCTENGNKEYYLCKCGKYFDSETGENEITARDSVIILGGHSFTKAVEDTDHLKYAPTSCQEHYQYYYECKECGIISSEHYFEGENEGLYVSKDSYLVKTLTRIFNETTNMNEEAIAIGGGTYARAFNNCVSFGMTFPNEEELCHQVNENIDIDNLLLATEIYTKAIIELAS